MEFKYWILLLSRFSCVLHMSLKMHLCSIFMLSCIVAVCWPVVSVNRTPESCCDYSFLHQEFSTNYRKPRVVISITIILNSRKLLHPKPDHEFTAPCCLFIWQSPRKVDCLCLMEMPIQLLPAVYIAPKRGWILLLCHRVSHVYNFNEAAEQGFPALMLQLLATVSSSQCSQRIFSPTCTVVSMLLCVEYDYFLALMKHWHLLS